MGTVYLGRSDRRVGAVKTMRGEFLDDPRFAVRFRREYQAVQAVRSTYVPRLLGADLSGRQPWIATEFVAGPTLERCVEERGPLPAGTVRALGAMLAAALAALHRAGVVHRDLKPSNILLAADGPRIVDFGIARLPAATAVTVTGQRPGSAGYMSPEQVRGLEVGTHSDVFTLGSVLVYASTGHHAFGDGGHALVDYQVAHGEPDLTRVPAPLADVLRSCLDKDPAGRPEAGELAERWGPPTSAWLPGHVERDIDEVCRRIRRLTGVRLGRGGRGGPGPGPGTGPGRRRLLGGLAGGVVLLTGLGGTAWWTGRDETDGSGSDGSGSGVPLWDGAPGERPEPLWSMSGLDPDMPFGPAPAGDVLLVGESGRVTALEPDTGDRLWSFPAAGAPVPRAPRPVLIGSEGVLCDLDPATGEVTRRGPGGLARLLAVEADTAYAADPDGRVVAVPRGSDEARWRSGKGLTPEGAVAAAADGRLVITGRAGAVTALDSASGNVSWTARGAVHGQRTALGGGCAVFGETELRALDLDSGTQRWKTPTTWEQNRFGAPTVHGGLVYVAERDLIRCLRLADGSGVREITGAGGTFASAPPVVAADGLYVPMAAGSDGVAALPQTGGAERYRFAPRSDGDGAWAVAAVGHVVAVQNGDRLHALPRF